MIKARVSYMGKDDFHKHRHAVIAFDESYLDIMYKIADYMKDEYGWDIQIVTDCCALCVVDDHNAYKDFVQDGKKQNELLNKKGRYIMYKEYEMCPCNCKDGSCSATYYEEAPR